MIETVLDATNQVLVLMLVGIGLAIIFGLMRVINMAHGEFVMLGAYAVLTVERAGGSYWLGFALAPLAVGLVGLVVEEAVIRRVYNRVLDSILATWGLSLLLKQSIVLVFGPGSHSIVTPVDAQVSILSVEYPLFRLFVMAVSAVAVAFTFWLFFRTGFGLRARAVIARRDMAACLGVNTRALDRITFVYGAALAGLAGATLAPMISVDPQPRPRVPGAGLPRHARRRPRLDRGPAVRRGRHRLDRQPGRAAVLPGLGAGRGLRLRHPADPRLPARTRRDAGAAVVRFSRLDAETQLASWRSPPSRCSPCSPARDAGELRDLLRLRHPRDQPRLRVGTLRLLSLGHAVYFGMGAYAMSVLTLGMVPGLEWLVSSWVGLLFAILLPAAFAWLVGWFLFSSRELRGAFFGIVTLAIAFIVERMAINWDYLGGLNGLMNVPPLVLGWNGRGYEVWDPLPLFAISLAVLAGCYAAVRCFAASRYGLALKALRDNELRGRALGYDSAAMKTTAYAVSGGVAGLAGALFSIQFGFVSPSLIGFALSAEALIWVALGGRGYPLAACLGAIAVRFAEERLSGALGDAWLVALGILFVLSVVFLPRGLFGELIQRAERARAAGGWTRRRA